MPHTPQAHLFVREMGLPARFVLYVLVCLFLLGLDARYTALAWLRGGLNSALHPLQQVLSTPWEWSQEVAGFFVTHGALKLENARLREERTLMRIAQNDRATLWAENNNLRMLLDLPTRPDSTTRVAEIIQTVPSPFSRKVVINRGQTHGLGVGWPVVDAGGLVGQVTRGYPFSSEVTLLTDRDQGAPVQNLRNGLRLIVSGTGSDRLLEVRFLDMHADIKVGDLLYTSGIDGVYPAGIPVAQVVKTEPPHNTPFARAYCRPLGGVGRYRHVAILTPLAPPPPTPTAKP
ncbi:MAG: rod shape-determining protein MreC [Pseudomonadota bacterium]|nr:rod shape-determining protein MreC [Pseudomonadota bacterium]MDP1902651.1 rod shape-determining protein MreC [Pseudomonadota bacterium]MDP2353998.1 rod shape-determining protein MreC [Pseudomonadota bacterium]